MYKILTEFDGNRYLVYHKPQKGLRRFRYWFGFLGKEKH